MTTLQKNQLTRNKLKNLIFSARKYVQQEQPQGDAVDYNWEEPHHFTPEQLVMFDMLSKKIGLQIEKAFDAMCEGEFIVSISPITQHFACKLAAVIPTEYEKHYFLPLTVNEERYGYVSIPPESALLLVGQMLRDTDTESEPGRELSRLEESILMDVVGSIVEAIDNSIKEHGGPVIEKTKQFVKDDWPLHFDGLEDLCSLKVTVDNPDGNIEFVFTILSGIIEPMLGAKAKTKSEYTSDEIRSMMMRNMHDVPVEVCARICSSSIALNDVMSLKEGDLLILDKKVEDPIEIILNKCPGMKAYPAAYLGKYAVVIAPNDA